jgi:ribosomal protein S18 acetylase RimI-like enzyme
VGAVHVRHLDYPADVAAILSFLPDLYESNFPGFVADAQFLARKRAQLREAVRDPGQVVLVAEDGAGVCGFIWLLVEEEQGGRRRGEVAAIYVAPRCRGQGLGRRLMTEAELLLKTHGCYRVDLMVTATNEQAVHLYQSLGYEITRYQMEKRLR